MNGAVVPVRRIVLPTLIVFVGCAPDARGGAGPELVPASALQVLGSAEVLGRATDVQPVAGGGAWVLNSMEPYFVALSPSGEVFHISGRRGGGPREFRMPTGLVAGSDAEDIWAFDRTRHTLIRLGSEEWQEIALPRDSVPAGSVLSFDNVGMFGMRPWMLRTADGFLLARTRPGFDASLRLWNADLLRIDAGTGAARTVLPIADLLGNPARRFGDVQYMLPFPMWSMCGDGGFVLYDPLRNQVRRFDLAGNEAEPRSLPAERAVEVTIDLAFGMAYRQALAESPAGQVDSITMRRDWEEGMRGIQSQTSRVFPEYSDMHCGAGGTVWLQQFNVNEGILGRASQWLRIDTNGAVREVHMPSGFQPYRFNGRVIWGVLLDPDGVPQIARLELD